MKTSISNAGKVWTFGWVAALIVIGFVIFFAVTRERRSDTLDNVSLRLGWFHQSQFAGFYVADKKGFYQDGGIQITINPGGPDFPSPTLVASGSDDFGIIAPSPQLLLARAEGAPLKAIAAIHQESPFIMFTKKGSDISTPQDFVGKKVAVVAGTGGEIIQRALWRKLGIQESQIEIFPWKFDISPFLTGQVDVAQGYITNEPILAEEQGVEVNIIKPSDYGINMYGDILITTDTMLQEKPDLVRRFVRASLRGWQYAVEHPEEAVDITLTYSDQLNRVHELKAMEESIPLIVKSTIPLGRMNESVWQETQQTLLDQRLLTRTLDLREVYTNEFLP